MEERLQKILSRAGFGSRRSCEELIKSGNVFINDKQAILGEKANPQKDKIVVKGEEIHIETEPDIYIALNKPKWVLSDASPEESRLSVYDLIPKTRHLFVVGRLDYNSQGLILMTSDGEIAYRLTHPRFGHEKEYQVLVQGIPTNDQLGVLQRGVVMGDGYRTKPAKVYLMRKEGRNARIKIVLREGKKRQIREMFSRIGMQVMELTRVRIGTIELKDLKPKEWRYLSTHEVEKLKTYVFGKNQAYY